MLIKPEPGRARIEELGSELRVTIPSRKNIFIILLLCVWLGGWLMGEIFAAREIMDGHTASGPQFFLIFWLCAWTLGGGFAILSLLWNIWEKK